MENFDFEIETENIQSEGAKIKVIGVGGGGGNMINHMINEGVSGIDLIAANTDAQALQTSLAPTKIQLGANITRGLGAGMKPEVGRESALENYSEIKDILVGADIVFISAGLGGGTEPKSISLIFSSTICSLWCNNSLLLSISYCVCLPA